MSAIFGETLTFSQERGPDVRLVVFGDEFYARYETTDGFTAIHDPGAGGFCYAELSGGELVSTGRPVTEPPPPSLRRHLKESEAVRNARFRDGFARRGPAPAGPDGAVTKTFGPNKGLLEGRRVSEGKVRGLVVLVQFQDVKSTVTAAEVEAMFNQQGFCTNGNACSVRDYFLKMSGGLLDFTCDVVGPITLSKNRQYYADNLLVREALDAAVRAGADLRRYDSKGEGIADAVSFLYAGQTQYQGELWPHNHVLDLRHGSVKTHFYMLSSVGRSAADLSIGTACHELTHMLCRAPDLYDYGERDGDFEKSAGLGVYCLMSAGNHLDSGRTPAPISGYLRDLFGWCQRVGLNQPGRYEARHGDYGRVLRFNTAKPGEYFIVENRSRRGHDAHLPAEGLAVYHCDTLGSNEWGGGTASKHFQCGLLQADGHLDLERNRNQGDTGDLFGPTDGIALSHATVPSSNCWDGAESGLQISSVSGPGEVITFVVGEGASSSVRGEASPRLKIPDNDPAGVGSSITVTQSGRVADLQVTVSVTHPYIGDLRLELVGPGGQRALLHDRAGGGARDIKRTYTTAAAPGLSAFVGQEVRGAWILRASDLSGRDVGTLERWGFEITTGEAPTHVVRGEAAPDLAIPDNAPAGVRSEIAVAGGGPLREAAVTVDIEHTYVGDLRVTLVAPGGQRVILHDRLGGGLDDLRTTFTPLTTPALTALAGQPADGTWALEIADLAAQDTGKLRRWSLELTCAA